MALKTIRNVHIICDGVLKPAILDGVTKLGANGYTWWKCHGKGEHEHVEELHSGLDRIYVEVWCRPEVAAQIVDFCQSDQFEAYGLSVGATPLEVFERDQF